MKWVALLGLLASSSGRAALDAGGSVRRGSASPDAGVASMSMDTEPTLKVAFVGDTHTGGGFQNVLKLIKTEKAQVLLVLGDMSYSSNPPAWYAMLDQQLGASFPVFLAAGNHDADTWPAYAGELKHRMKGLGVTPDEPGLDDEKYAFVFKGLKVVVLGQNGQNTDFAAFADGQLANDAHTWRICMWHKNQKAMQVGGKGDEMGWPVYEVCRARGAIIATGHEHSYSRTKTLSSMEAQTVDPSCSAPAKLCVGPGKSFAFVSGLGGSSIRSQRRCTSPEGKYPYGCKGEWASVYTSSQDGNYGVLFITFNVDGDPRKAKGYFKSIDGAVVDEFTVIRQ
ncbi:MAG: metallophosphoesterase [Myxococcaceae bacterium]